MRIVCPACHKDNGEASSGACVRCGCALDRLQLVSRCADQCLVRAAARLRAGDPMGALRLAEQSWRLRRQPEAARLAFLAAIGYGAPGRASLWLRRACDPK